MAFSSKITDPLKQAWADSNKKAVKIFSAFAFIAWLGFVGVFWLAFRSADNTAGEDSLISSLGFSEKPVSSTDESAGQQMDTFKPEFLEAYGTKHVEDLYAHRELMDSYLKKGKINESVYHMDRIEKFFKDDSLFIKQSAQLFLDLGEYAKAVEMAGKGFAFAPDDPSLKSIEIMGLYRDNHVDSAVTAAKRAIKKFPGNPELLTALGTINMETKLGVPGNDRYLRKALKAHPNYIPALYQIGRKHKLEGNYADSRSVFRKIIKLDPANAKARGHMGAIHYYFNNTKLALQEYETALTLNPADFNTWYNKGELYMSKSYSSKSIKVKKEFQKKAFESYHQTLKYNPAHEQANFRVGVILNGNRQFKEAIRHFEVVLSKSPSDIRTLIQISVAYEELERRTEALDYLKRAFKIDPNNLTVIQKLKLLS